MQRYSFHINLQIMLLRIQLLAERCQGLRVVHRQGRVRGRRQANFAERLRDGQVEGRFSGDILKNRAQSNHLVEFGRGIVTTDPDLLQVEDQAFDGRGSDTPGITEGAGVPIPQQTFQGGCLIPGRAEVPVEGDRHHESILGESVSVDPGQENALPIVLQDESVEDPAEVVSLGETDPGDLALFGIGSDREPDLCARGGVLQRLGERLARREFHHLLGLRDDQLGESVQYLKDGMTLERTTYQGETIGVELPVTVDLKVTTTDPGFAGDTAQGARKPATLETGLVVQVPEYLSQGESIKVDTRSGEYLSRA